MPRKSDPNSTYKVHIYVNSGYSTQPSFVDPETGKRKHKRILWGTLNESKKIHS